MDTQCLHGVAASEERLRKVAITTLNMAVNVGIEHGHGHGHGNLFEQVRTSTTSTAELSNTVTVTVTVTVNLTSLRSWASRVFACVSSRLV